MSTTVESVHCFIRLLVAPAYSCLTVVALLSPLVPYLGDLASHGKTLASGRATASASKGSCTSRHFPFNEALWIHKRFFVHFYVTGLLSLTVFLVAAEQPLQFSYHQWCGIVLLALHLGRRCYECVYVHRCSKDSRMHLAGYICGVFHYLFLPFMFFEASTCSGDREDVSLPKTVPIHAMIRVGLNLWAQFEQYQHHCLLSSLRPSSSSSSDTANTATTTTINHKIPRGRLFHYVSCPHYLAEIIIYASLCLALSQDTDCTTTNSRICRDRFPSAFYSLGQRHSSTGTILEDILVTMSQRRRFVLFLWVASNLTVTSLRCHRWYLQKFPSYHLLQRKAILPGIL
jgi:3-oxo-5-alpha-steroid 4-dehydrogenase 3 / polyprenol reductase